MKPENINLKVKKQRKEKLQDLRSRGDFICGLENRNEPR
jgi:hypothetical protein